MKGLDNNLTQNARFTKIRAKCGRGTEFLLAHFELAKLLALMPPPPRKMREIKAAGMDGVWAERTR